MKKFSVIVKVSDAGALKTLMDSLQKQQGIAFEKDVQVILADVAHTKEVRESLEKYADMGNISRFSCEKSSLCACAKEAMSMVNGQYVSVITDDCFYSEGAFSAILSAFESEKKEDAVLVRAVSLSPVFLLPQDGGECPYDNQPKEEQETVLSLEKKPQNIQLMPEGYFLTKELFEKIGFDENAILEEGRYLAVMDLIRYLDSYVFLPQAKLYFSVAREDFIFVYADKRETDWYTKSVREVYIPYAKRVAEENGLVNPMVAAVIVYLLYHRFEVNKKERDMELLKGEDLDEFLDACVELLSYVPYECIMQRTSYSKEHLPDFMRYAFMKKVEENYHRPYQMYNCRSAFYYTDSQMQKDEMVHLNKIVDYSERFLRIVAMNVERDQLVICGEMGDLPLLADHNLRIVAKINGEIQKTKRTEVYNLRKYFGRVFAKDYTFKLNVPLEGEEKITIEFLVRSDYGMVRPQIRLVKPASRISGEVRNSYWRLREDRVLQLSDNTLIISKADDEKCKKLEMLVQQDAFLSQLPSERAQEFVSLRKKYFEYKDKYKNKNIWITFDRLYKAGDNGEYVFRYISDNVPDVDIYYIMKEECPDYVRLKKKYKNILIHGSEEAKLMVLLADAILSPHMSVFTYCGFEDEEMRYFWDLFRAEIVCIQHGLTVQNIAQWQNRLLDNIRLYGCASKYEVSNLERPIYGYNPKRLVLTGLARFDGLKSVKTKQILISPTWRRNLVNTRIGHNKNLYNHQFIHSEYYRRYNGLINDERLLQCARKNGYKILFLLHPVMSSQVDDFKGNDVVQVKAASDDVSYEYVLTHSDVMVTDYSGIQFDFAYMRKPLLYYHPKNMPSHYTESEYFRYAEMGFGPIIEEHEELVDELIRLMENGCKNTEMYLERANDFFAFDDYNNCQRIFMETRKYLLRKGIYKKSFSEKVREKIWKKDS